MDAEVLNQISTAKGRDLWYLTNKYFSGPASEREYRKLLRKRYAELIPKPGMWGDAVKIVNQMSPPSNYVYRDGLPKVLGYWCDWVEGDNPYFLLINHVHNFVYRRFMGSPNRFKKTTAEVKEVPVDEEYEQTKAIFK